MSDSPIYSIAPRTPLGRKRGSLAWQHVFVDLLGNVFVFGDFGFDLKLGSRAEVSTRKVVELVKSSDIHAR